MSTAIEHSYTLIKQSGLVGIDYRTLFYLLFVLAYQVTINNQHERLIDLILQKMNVPIVI